MIYVFYIFAALLVYLSYKSYRGGLEYFAHFRRETARADSAYQPFASVFAPCRGLDDGLAENLAALLRQNYPRFEVIFAVDSAADEAVPVIEKLLRESGARAKLVVAGRAAGESQKVHNLREAVTQAAPESEIFVFVDSDARPAADWLAALVAPLADETVGASTGYRWFIAKTRSLASEMRAVWNASIASALGADGRKNFCWGGSMAMRRALFDEIRMRERWRGALSDDFAVTRAMRENELSIHFAPRALTASIENCTARELFEFTTRQMKITRVYAPDLWRQALIGAALFNLVWIWGSINLLVHPFDSLAFRASVAALALVAVFSAGKSYWRLRAVALVLKRYDASLRRQFWPQHTLWIFSPALYFYNSLCALVSRRIRWRGICYELRSATETVIIEPDTTDREPVTSEIKR